MSTKLYGTSLRQMETYLVNEKQEIHMIHRPWLSRVCPTSCWVCAKENIFNLFDIYVMLYYVFRCVKIQMVKNWQIFGCSSISPNFCSAKVSLHTVYRINFFTVIHLKLIIYMYQSSQHCKHKLCYHCRDIARLLLMSKHTTLNTHQLASYRTIHTPHKQLAIY